MNKKLNTFFFILGATILNMFLMVLLFSVTFLIYGVFIASRLSSGINTVFVLALFVISIIVTYLIYHRIVNFMSKKIDFEKYFDPLFKPRRRNKG